MKPGITPVGVYPQSDNTIPIETRGSGADISTDQINCIKKLGPDNVEIHGVPPVMLAILCVAGGFITAMDDKGAIKPPPKFFE